MCVNGKGAPTIAKVLEEKGILKKIFTSDISKTENFIIYEMKQ